MYRLFPLILLLLTATVACRHRPPAEPRKYLFLGHPYAWSGSGDRMDARVERLPFDGDTVFVMSTGRVPLPEPAALRPSTASK